MPDPPELVEPGPTPRQLTGLAALRAGWQLARDQLRATQQVYDEHGAFAIARHALPLVNPAHIVLLGAPLVFTAGAAFNREAFNSPAWRPVSLFPGGPRKSASRRLSENLTRMTGARHAHYRKLITPPLRKIAVDAMAEQMALIADEELARWPVGEAADLGAHLYRLVRRIAVELLFGGDQAQGYPIADMAADLVERKWAPGVISFPVDLPVTPYGASTRLAAELERAAVAWTESKRGPVNSRDLVSIMINTPGPDARPPDAAATARSVPALVAMAQEACHTTLIWILVLLDQHPSVARDLLEEVAGASSPAETILRLPRLEAVIKEAMRIIPPVPLQMRVAEEDATLAGYPLPRRTRLLLNAFLTNRMPDLYQQPDRFRPGRWSAIDPNPYEFMTFGAGSRQCPGYAFGMNLMKIALATILRRYRVALAPGSHIDYRVQPTLRPTGVVNAVFHREDGAFSAAQLTGTVRHLVRLD